jgi:hypothetical protein
MTIIDLSLSSPGHERLSVLIAELASRAAVTCGHSSDRAAAFAGDVASAVDAACNGAPASDHVTCRLHHDTGPLEVVITSHAGSRTLTLEHEAPSPEH